MQRRINILILFLFASVLCDAQNWNQFENEYNALLKNKQNDLALVKAKEMYSWVKTNESDTSIHLPISLKYIGNAFINNDSAIIYYDIALNVLKKQKRESHIQAAKIHFNESNRYRSINNKELCLREAESSIQILTYLKFPEYPFCTWPLKIAAELYEEKGDYPVAIQYYGKAAELIERYKGKNNNDYANNLLSIGNINWLLKKFDSSKIQYANALAIQKKLLGAYNFEYLKNLKLVENLYRDKYFYEDALTLYLNTEKTQRVEKDSKNQQIVYSNLLGTIANLYKDIEMYDSSYFYFSESIHIIKSMPSDSIIDYLYATDLVNLGLMYYEKGEYQSAEQNFKTSLDVFRNTVGENHYAYVANINNLGGVYSAIKNWSKAIEYFLIALDIDKKIHGEKSSNYASDLNNLGIAYNNLGLYDEAVKYCNQALDIRKNVLGVENKNYANSLSTMGAIYSTVKDYNSADSCYNQSVRIIKRIYGANHSVYGYALASLGGFYLKFGNYEKAEKCLTESFMVNKRILGEGYPGYIESLGDMANLHQAKGDFKSAIKLYSEIYDLSVNLIARDFQWMSEKEKENYWQEKSILLERITFFSASFYIKNQSLTELTYNVNLVSNSLLMESSNDLKKVISKSKDSSLIDIYNDLKTLRNYGAKLASEGSGNIELISKLEHQGDSLDQLLSRKMSSYADYKKNFSLTWKDVQVNLNSNEAAIEFARYYDDKDSAYHYLALIVKQGDKYPALVKLCSEDELKRFSPEKELNDLYSLLWKPISNQLTGIKTIYYTPAGLMNNIPFQALYEDKMEGREYLMDKYSLNQLTSTRYLALGLKKRAEEPIETNIALFGGVNYNDLPDSKSDTSNYLSSEAAFLYKNAIASRDLEDTRSGASYLPGTKKEVEGIADLLKSNKWDVNVIEGKNASEDKVKNLVGKNSKSIMHIATHGFAFPDKENNKKRTEIGLENGNERYKVAENPMIRSGLLFSGSNMTWQGKGDSLLKMTNEDGVLTAYELSQLSLDNTKLVVLSACETGKGAIQGSEGTFGLKRALKLAGVDNMIVSLWKVPDDATMEMMTIFYTELAKTKKPVPAFELAQKTMRNKYPNEPKKWAGFVFVR